MKVFKNRVFAALMAVCMMIALLPVSALAAENDYSLSIDVKGTGVTWYAKDEAGAEIVDGNYAIPTADIQVDTDGDVPTVTLTTTLYVKANRGYSLNELTDFDVGGSGEQENTPSAALDVKITDDAEYCDLKVTVIFDGYALAGKSTSITLTIDADPIYELSLDLEGTGVTWYAKDEAGAEIVDGNYAIPTADIQVDTDGDVPTVTLTTTLYVKANPGYSLDELTAFDAGDNGEVSSATFDAQITDDAEYCDLKVTVMFNGYALKGTATSIKLTIDADPTYFTITAGGEKLDTSKFSTTTYADAEAILHEVAHNAQGTTVAVAAYVSDPEDGVIVELVGKDGPAFDDELRSGSSLFVDVTPENTVENPVYVAVKYVPDKTGAAEAKPYDEIFKIALYMAPGAASSFTDVSSNDYFYDAVAWAVDQGITKDTGDGTTFSPLNGCTRAQFVTFLWRAANSPEPSGSENPFSDVSETTHKDYYKAILWASDKEITSGTGDGSTFSPSTIVTRAQAVTFMYRYAKLFNLATRTGVESFDDVTDTGAMVPYYDAIGWAVANGITGGNSATANTFDPMGQCNRAMMVTFLHRLFTDATA